MRKMPGMSRVWMPLVAVLILLGFAVSCTSDKKAPAPDAVCLFEQGVNFLYHHRHEDAEPLFRQVAERYPDDFIPRFNLAVAQLNQVRAENTKHEEVLATLALAERIRPNAHQVPYVRGILYYHLGKIPEATAQFQRAVDLAPENADAHYWLARMLRDGGEDEKALPHFEVTAQRDPGNLSAWYALSFLYRGAGREADAERALQKFQALTDSKRGFERDVKYTEMGEPANGLTGWLPLGGAEPRVDVVFASPVPLAGVATPFAFVDADRDCIADLWSSGEQGTVWEFEDVPQPKRHELPALAGVQSFAVTDINEDLVVDVITLRGGEIVLYETQGPVEGAVPRLERRAAFAVPGAAVAAKAGCVRVADMDLESDLDLIYLGQGGQSGLALNEGRKLLSFAESVTLHAGLALPVAAGYERDLLVRDLDGDGDVELYLAGDKGVTVIDNAPQWEFQLAPPERRIEIRGKVTAILSADLDADADEDLIVAGEAGAAGIYWNDGRGNFAGPPVEAEHLTSALAICAFDADLDGWIDIAIGRADRTVLLANLAAGKFATGKASLPPASALASADVDGDYDLDLVLTSPSGAASFLSNLTNPRALAPPYHILRGYFGGDNVAPRRANRLGVGVRYELHAGNLAQYGTYDGGIGAGAQGMAPFMLGIGPRAEVGVMLMRWPDQVLQSERDLALEDCIVITEVDRKPDSCPVLFSWDGERYRFITDFLGAGGLGVWVGMDRYEPFDPTETVRIAPGEAAPLGGMYRLSVMEPMEEVSYIDELVLRVVDHAPGTLVFPDEILATSPAITATGGALAIESGARAFPADARDEAGKDVRAALRDIDRVYAGASRLDPDLKGYAATHALTLSFGPELPQEGDVRLFLHGWIEYPSSHTNFAAYQRGLAQSPPSIYWRRAAGEEWTLLYERAGLPAGFPKTMVLDISAAIRAGARELRIETDMEIYWDQIFAARLLPADAVRETKAALGAATLRFGGYPRWYSSDGAAPKTYHYDEREPHVDFKRFAGALTAYGDVRDLVAVADDRFALVGSGDELLVSFDATALPALPPGWVRTLLLDTRGYCKGMDPLSASPETVEPLPFATMRTFPFDASDAPPPRADYESRWNTRPSRAAPPRPPGR